jgi:hypothetical protein
MARPINSPLFATAATYPAGSFNWSGQSPRVAPSAGSLAQGFTPQTNLPAEYMNFLVGNHGDWLNHYDSIFTDHDFHFVDDFMGGVIDTSKGPRMANSIDCVAVRSPSPSR